jgi:hypothetical protein
MPLGGGKPGLSSYKDANLILTSISDSICFLDPDPDGEIFYKN